MDIKKLYFKASYLAKKIKSFLIETFALLMGKKFHCNALNGNSKFYNISINSDMTLSCNCSDIYGEGNLGDLNNNTLKEIYFGKKAEMFRKKLSQGRLPITNCSTCFDLCIVQKRLIVPRPKMTRTLLIENTADCNVECLGCYRNSIYSKRKNLSISLPEMEKLSMEIQKNKIEKLYFYNQGEPFMHKNIIEQLSIIRKHNTKIKIIISTNGILISKKNIGAAVHADEIIFSIPGCDKDSYSKYMKGGNFKRAIENMRALAETTNKPLITWKYVLFWWNDGNRQIKKALDIAKEIGVDRILFERTTYPIYSISIKHHLGRGYCNNLGKFKDNVLYVDIGK